MSVQYKVCLRRIVYIVINTIFLVAEDWLHFFISNVSRRKILLEQYEQNQLLFEFFMSWLSTKFLHLRCIVLKYWAQTIEFLWLTVLLHVLHVGFKHMWLYINKFAWPKTKSKRNSNNLVTFVFRKDSQWQCCQIYYWELSALI